MLAGKIAVGQRFFNAVLHLPGSLFQFHGAQLFHHGFGLFAGSFLAFLSVDRLEHLGHQLYLGAWRYREHVTVEVDGTPLVFGLRKHFSHSLQHTKTLVTNHQLDSIQATATQPLEETDPTGLVFFHALGCTKNLAVAILVDRNGYQNGYYEVVYILFHTGMRISEFCGLTLKDLDMKNRIINIDHQLQRTSDMRLVIESTKTNAGTRKLPMSEDVFRCFQAIIEDRETPRYESVVEGYTGFLFTDKEGLPLVAMHWEHRFKHMVKRYNDIYRVQMPNITPHVCRHTYCSNMAKSGMNPKTLQYLMGHSDIGVTLNTYTHLGLEDAVDELKRVEELENARKEMEKINGEGTVSQKMFRVI